MAQNSLWHCAISLNDTCLKFKYCIEVILYGHNITEFFGCCHTCTVYKTTWVPKIGRLYFAEWNGNCKMRNGMESVNCGICKMRNNGMQNPKICKMRNGICKMRNGMESVNCGTVKRGTAECGTPEYVKCGTEPVFCGTTESVF